MISDDYDIQIGFLGEQGFVYAVKLFKMLKEYRDKGQKEKCLGDWISILTNTEIKEAIRIFNNFNKLQADDYYLTSDLLLATMSIVSLENNESHPMDEFEINKYLNLLHTNLIFEKIVREGGLTVYGKAWLTKDIARYKVKNIKKVPKWLKDFINQRADGDIDFGAI